MATVLLLRDGSESGGEHRAIIVLASGEKCAILLDSRGARVRKSLIGTFGPAIYRERDNAKTTVMAFVLIERYPVSHRQLRFASFELKAYANAVMHCGSCREVAVLFRQMEQRSPPQLAAPALVEQRLDVFSVTAIQV